MKNKRVALPLVGALIVLIPALTTVQAAFGPVAQNVSGAVAEWHPDQEVRGSPTSNSIGQETRPVNTSENVHVFNNAYFAFDEGLAGDEADAAVDRNVKYAAEHYGVTLVSWYNLQAYPYLITRFHQYNAATMVVMDYSSFSCVVEADDWYDDLDQNHDEWFLKDSDGNRIRWDAWPDHWFIDIGNPGYQDYWVGHMIAKAQDVIAGEDGWDGVYMNNVHTAMFGGVERNTTYVTDAEYERAQYTYLAHVHSLFHVAGIPILINLAPSPSVYSTTEWAQLTEGVKIQHFVSSWSGYQNAEAWEQQVGALEEIGRAGRISTVYPDFRDDNMQARLYGLASYLLGKQGPHDFFYYAIHPASWPPIWFPEWETRIGHPIGDRYKAQGVWQRSYSKGKVLANPSSDAYVIDLGGAHQTISGAIVTSLLLGAHEGAILLLPPFRVPFRALLPIVVR